MSLLSLPLYTIMDYLRPLVLTSDLISKFRFSVVFSSADKARDFLTDFSLVDDEVQVFEIGTESSLKGVMDMMREDSVSTFAYDPQKEKVTQFLAVSALIPKLYISSGNARA